LDTSAIVALLCPWHENHQRVVDSTTASLRSGAGLGLAAHSLVEAYAVLTRLPAPYRLSSVDTLELLRKNFGAARIAALDAAEHWTLIELASSSAVSGGRTYDALIVNTAAKLAPCDLLTLNARHFAAFDAPGVTLVDLGRS